MTKAELRALAVARMAQPELRRMPGTARWAVADGLPGAGCVGIELGVAAGSFAERMVGSGRFEHYFGVDVYGDLHNAREYKKALVRVGMISEFRLLRLTFDQALDLFPEEFFDFIYIDGYAHTGEEGGRTLVDWYPKLKPGGIMAGDDYALEDWPLVVWAVNDFVAQLGVPLQVTTEVSDAPYNKFPSWWFVKPEGVACEGLRLTPELVEIADAEKARIARQRAGVKKAGAKKAGVKPAP